MAKKEIEQTEIEAPYELPEGWKWCRLGDCSSLISKGTTPKGGKEAYIKEGINFLRIENLNEDGSINHSNISHISKEEHEGSLKRSILEAGDLLISIAGTLGKVGFVRECDLPMNTNQAIAFVRLHKNLFENMYLKYAIESPLVNNKLLSKTKVTSIPNLTLEIISNCKIPLPPTLAEQQRIVNRIESMFAKLDEAKEKAQNVVDGFEIRKAAILHKAFTGELTAKWRRENDVGDDSWEEKTIGEICKFIGGGTPDKTNQNYWNGNVHWASVKDIKGDKLFSTEDKITELGLKESSAKLAKIDDIILITRISPGKAIITKIETAVNQDLKIVETKEYKPFLKFFFDFSENEIKLLSSGTTVKGIKLEILNKLSILVPTLPEQQEIVRILDIIIEKENKAKQAAEAVLEQIDLLKKSILARAFRGEL